MRAGSERVPNKNTKTFSGVKGGLCKIKLEQLINCSLIDSILVSTTIIEVGIDFPNANVIIIENANKFGLSQLHQLRGRVGRGTSPGLCLLVTSAPADSTARERLDAVSKTQDGFELSRIDLEQRREGDVLGASQSGSRSHLRLLRVLRDEGLIESAREVAAELLAEGAELNGYPLLKQELAKLQASKQFELYTGLEFPL